MQESKAKEKALSYFNHQVLGYDIIKNHGVILNMLDIAINETKKEVFDDIENRCSIWSSNDIYFSPETKCDDKWLSMNIIKKLKQKHLGERIDKNG